MSALGAFSQSIIVSTVYTKLGDEAVMHALNETEVESAAGRGKGLTCGQELVNTLHTVTQ